MNRQAEAVLGQAFRPAVVTMLAVLATFACTMAIAPEPGPGVLAVVLCLSFARSHLDHDLRGRLEAAIELPLVALGAAGTGFLLLHRPWLGASVFVGGMFASIWLRRFGPGLRRAGSLIALPLVALLTTPYAPTRPASPLMHLLVPVLVAWLALAWVSTMQLGARRLGWLAPVRRPPPRTADTSPTAAEHTPRLIASTRMAIQMAAALAAAFVVGYLGFAERWAWVVLTAFIVNSGNRGRLDVAYKSVLRVTGTGVGTLAALALAGPLGGHDGRTVAMILAAVFLGLWLRPLGYAWWALFVTIALALLQGFEGTSSMHVLWPRLEEIVVGAAIGVAAAWLVLPIRSSAVLRRRIANALALLAASIEGGESRPPVPALALALDEVDQLAPAFRFSRWATRRFRSPQPADWIDALSDCRASALALAEQGTASLPVRRAVGQTRKALRDPGALLPALQQLRSTLLELQVTGGDRTMSYR